LPLKEPQNIGVFGNDAADFTVGQYSSAFGGNYDIGTLATGGGSGSGRFTYIVSPLEAIKTRGMSYGALVQYITDNKAIVAGGLANIAPSPPDVCLVFLKSWASEGADRTSLVAEWNSTMVVNEVASACPNTIVILHGASPNVLPWKDNENVTAIVVAHMPGQESGNSLVDILWGDINPSGKLPYTIANRESDYEPHLVNSSALLTSTDPDAWQDDFTEGNMIDYKEFDGQNKSVAYEFGFGLSYTTFELADFQVESTLSNVSRVPNPSASIQPGGNTELWETVAVVRAKLTNTGPRSGAAVPQLYVAFPVEAGEDSNVKSLRGFQKVTLASNASADVHFPLARRDLSYWDVSAQTWRLPSNAIRAYVGFSSRDLKLNGQIDV
jgi:beta-glucosidase